MTTPFITVTPGGPEVPIPDGVYTVTLTEINGPKTVTAQRGKNAGKDIDLLDWIFAIDAGPLEGNEVEASTSTASGPRSKLYGFLTALFGGQAPPIGTQVGKDHLIGRRALATIRTDESGWPRIENLSALPAQMYAPGPVPEAAAVPQPATAPAAPQQPVVPTDSSSVVPGTARDQVAQPQADLPF